MSLSALRALERARLSFGADAAETKLTLLKALARTRLASAASVA